MEFMNWITSLVNQHGSIQYVAISLFFLKCHLNFFKSNYILTSYSGCLWIYIFGLYFFLWFFELQENSFPIQVWHVSLVKLKSPKKFSWFFFFTFTKNCIVREITITYLRHVNRYFNRNNSKSSTRNGNKR
jgi:hypothetical protein